MNKLEHISTIDFCYWRLKILCEQLSKPKSNIEIMVDNACGYNETEDARKENIEAFNNIESFTIDDIKNYGNSEYLKGYYYVYRNIIK